MSHLLLNFCRRGSTSKQLFTCNFCTMYCALQWLSGNTKKYYQVDWKVSDDDDDHDDEVDDDDGDGDGNADDENEND